MQSNEPYQALAKQGRETNTTIGSGIVWGGASGAVTGGLTTAAMQYLKKGDLNTMSKISPSLAAGAQSYRETSDILKKAPNSVGTKTEKQVSKMMYNSLFNTTQKGHAKRVGASVLLGGVIGSLHNASNGVVL